MKEIPEGLSRKDFLRAAGVTGALGVSGALLGAHATQAHGQETHGQGNSGGKVAGDAGEHDAGAHEGDVGQHGGTGDVDLSRFDPSEFLRDFYWGEERRENGRTVREYEMVAEDAEIEVAPGVFYPAWTFNGQVPGPTLRANDGLLRALAGPHSARDRAERLIRFAPKLSRARSSARKLSPRARHPLLIPRLQPCEHVSDQRRD